MWQLIIHRWRPAQRRPRAAASTSRMTAARRGTGSPAHGLPPADHALGKIAVAVAPSNPNRVYALVQDAPAPGLYRSNDRGETWNS